MNSFLAPECSDDCESGWTLYLEQSFLPHPNPKHRNNSTGFVDSKSTGFCREGKDTREEYCEEEEEEEEDLSMVSDASSGPPHFKKMKDLLNNGAIYSQKKKEHRRRHKQDQQLPSFLDDTASSPAFNFSKNNFALSSNQASMESVLDYSQGFSATHFQVVLGEE
ncbi:protein SOB FIVE [Salix suchowensis]|nr:protein SOB FIVE [Salix suchowensis]